MPKTYIHERSLSTLRENSSELISLLQGLNGKTAPQIRKKIRGLNGVEEDVILRLSKEVGDNRICLSFQYEGITYDAIFKKRENRKKSYVYRILRRVGYLG